MATRIQNISFEGTTAAAVDTLVNAYLETKDAKDVLDIIRHSFSSSKYGMTRTYVATVVFSAEIV